MPATGSHYRSSGNTFSPDEYSEFRGLPPTKNEAPEQVRGKEHVHIFCLIFVMNRYYVYILTNLHHMVFYTGFTGDLERRVYEHKHRILEGFTKKYNCDKLVYYEEFTSPEEALHREKQIKRYRRDWKKNLINSINPTWCDLYQDFLI